VNGLSDRILAPYLAAPVLVAPHQVGGIGEFIRIWDVTLEVA
jgi:hypothetical protein